MNPTIRCVIVSAEKEIFSGMVQFMSVTGSLGDLGVTPGHAPLLTGILPGPVELRLEGGEMQVFYVSGGYLEVQPNMATVLADTVLRGDEIDEAAADASQREAQRALDKQASELDYQLAATRLAESAAQLRTLKQLRNLRRS